MNYGRPPAPSDGRPSYHPDLTRRWPHRAATVPSAPTSSRIHHYGSQPAYSPPIYPAQGQRPPQTIHRPDIYFSSSAMDRTYSDDFYQSRSGNGYFSGNTAQLYPPHQQQYHALHHSRSPSPAPPPKPPGLQQQVRRDSQGEPLHPAFYRSFVSSPPVPPKPDLLFETPAIPTSAYLGNASSASLPSTSTTQVWPSAPPSLPSGMHAAQAPPYPAADTRDDSDNEADELAMALALSKDESMREAERLQDLARQEEEEMERALAASMQISRGRRDQYWSKPDAGPSNYASSSSSPGPNISGPSSIATLKDASEESSSVSHVPKRPPDRAITSKKEPLSQTEEAEVPVETPINTTVILATQCLSIDVNEHPEPLQSDNSLPKYSPNRTPTALTPPPDNNHAEPIVSSSSEEKSRDDEHDCLPYLWRTGGDTPTNAIPSSVRSLSSNSDGATGTNFTSFMDFSYDDSYIDEDEALARRLAEEERREVASEAVLPENGSGYAAIPLNTSAPNASVIPIGDLPSYDAVVSTSSTDKPLQTVVPEIRVDASPSVSLNDGLSRNSSLNSGTSDALSNVLETSAAIRFPSGGPRVTTLQVDEPQRVIGRTSSMSALPVVTHPHEVSSYSPSRTDDDIPSPPASFDLEAVTNTASTNVVNANSPPDAPATLGMLNASHFIDAELLHGVSISFSPPIISDRVSPMKGQMPTLISLPYGRCPPLHFQAPSWRHLLKLMARLSGTKIEPTIEAMAINKNELPKLRTVVQFIKPHHMSREWRTVLWFTIDQPVPLNASNAQRYQIANVNALPWSYTLSSVPTMLKDASDTLLSKTYTVPETASVPFPSLPITFPNLALYLQATLDDSRRQNESNPHHKLAKMVELCYANDNVTNGIDEPDKPTGVSGLFKKVIGKGSKKGRKNGGGNEETYDRVTPFLPDEWG